MSPTLFIRQDVDDDKLVHYIFFVEHRRTLSRWSPLCAPEDGLRTWRGYRPEAEAPTCLQCIAAESRLHERSDP